MPDNQIGRASLLIVPRFDNLTESVNSALRKAGAQAGKSGQGLGERVSSGFGGGLARSGALIGAFSSLTSSAISAISSRLGDAISRFDTLNNYPRTMELLGYSAESAEASITKMSDRLQALPTRLDDMVGTVQGIVAITGDLDKATDAGLALNDMLVASGSSQQLVTSAMEQFRQMLAKGKPEMEDWRSLTSAAPGQMQQLAEAMLGPTANANDLYAALGGGKNDPVFTMDQLIDKMIELDNVGGDGITSFREQAETAAGGVQTAMANMGNAVTKGIAGLMDEVGQGRISGVLNDVKVGINDAFGAARDLLSDVLPVADDLYETIKPMVPDILTFGASFGVVSTVGGKAAGAVSGLVRNAKRLTPEMGALQKVTTLLGGAFDPLSIGMGLASAAISAGIAAYVDYEQHQRLLADATMTASEVMGEAQSAATGLGDAIGSIEPDVEGVLRGLADVNSTVGDAFADVYVDSAKLDQYLDVIGELANQSGLTATEQWRLREAVKGYNDVVGTQYEVIDAANGKIADQDGVLQENTDQIRDNAEAWRERARAEAYQGVAAQYMEAEAEAAYELQVAQDRLSEAQGDYNDTLERMNRITDKSSDEYQELGAHLVDLGREMPDLEQDVEELSAAYETAGGNARDFSAWAEIEASGASDAVKESARSVMASVNDLDAGLARSLENMGYNLTDLSIGLAEAGVSTEELADVGSEALARLSQSCEGDVERMVWSIANYNDVPVLDKDGTVRIDDAELMDSQGNVYEWNGTTLADKDGNVVVDDQELVDAQGRVWVWNDEASALVPKWTRVTVDTSSIDLAEAKWRRASFGWKTTGVRVNFSSGSTTLSGHVYTASRLAAGGIIGRPAYHAEGGVISHADGFIANRPGPGVPLHVVGEAGAEAVVPLTNRRYSQPFADVIAEGVERRLSGAGATNIYINGLAASGDAELSRAIQVIARRARMRARLSGVGR